MEERGEGEEMIYRFSQSEDIGCCYVAAKEKGKEKEIQVARAMRSRNEFSAVKSNRVIFLIVTN